MVKLLGSNPDALFTFDNLKSEMKRCGNFALLMGPMIIEISQANPSEASKLDEMFEKLNKGEAKQELVTGLSEQGQFEFNRRINVMVENIIQLDYYRKINKS